MSTSSGPENFKHNHFHLKSRKQIKIQLINGDTLLQSYDKDTCLSSIFDSACNYNNIRHKDLFGLAVSMDDFYIFLDLQSKISKINFKSFRRKLGFFKSSSELDLSLPSDEPGLPVLHLRVQFYVRSYTLKDRATKHYYYEQLRDNLLNYQLFCGEESYFQLAALALQADLGYLSEVVKKAHATEGKPYFDPKKYVPHWLISRYGETYILRNLPKLHQSHERLSRPNAELHFILLASAQPAHFNMHLCRMTERATFDRKQPIWLGLSAQGLELYEERKQGFLVHMSTVMWTQHARISCKKRRFSLRVIGGRVIVLEGARRAHVEQLFWLCQRMHERHISPVPPAPFSREVIEQYESQRYRESYIYIDSNDLEEGSRADSPSYNMTSRWHDMGHMAVATDGYLSLPCRPPRVTRPTSKLADIFTNGTLPRLREDQNGSGMVLDGPAMVDEVFRDNLNGVMDEDELTIVAPPRHKRYRSNDHQRPVSAFVTTDTSIFQFPPPPSSPHHHRRERLYAPHTTHTMNNGCTTLSEHKVALLSALKQQTRPIYSPPHSPLRNANPDAGSPSQQLRVTNDLGPKSCDIRSTEVDCQPPYVTTQSGKAPPLEPSSVDVSKDAHKQGHGVASWNSEIDSSNNCDQNDGCVTVNSTDDIQEFDVNKVSLSRGFLKKRSAQSPKSHSVV